MPTLLISSCRCSGCCSGWYLGRNFAGCRTCFPSVCQLLCVPAVLPSPASAMQCPYACAHGSHTPACWWPSHHMGQCHSFVCSRVGITQHLHIAKTELCRWALPHDLCCLLLHGLMVVLATVCSVLFSPCRQLGFRQILLVSYRRDSTLTGPRSPQCSQSRHQ